MRRLLCAGNWKMHKTSSEALGFVRDFLAHIETIPERVEIALCPPFTALAAVSVAITGSRIQLGAQNLYWEHSGAFTGEISSAMLADLGVRFVIAGHSERRELFGETDEMVRRKTAAALDGGLVPIVAVGETLEIREAGKAHERVTAQTRAALQGLTAERIAQVVMAYEPVWAIGTGHNCDPGEANAVMGAMRACLPQLKDVSILYGGSVKTENIASYMTQPEIDGALVGGASLDPAVFAQLCTAACR